MIASVRFYKVPVTLDIQGPLHATSPSSPDGQKFMLERRAVNDAELEARANAGEEIVSIDQLKAQVQDEIPETERAMSVFRRDNEGMPFIHANFIKGHLRDAADALSRPLNIWGFQKLVTTTLFVLPYRIHFKGKIEVETWKTHFDIHRMGRVAAFRVAEYVENPHLEFYLYILNDPRWTVHTKSKEPMDRLWVRLLEYGSMRGIGGGRGRGMGQYTYQVGNAELVERMEVEA